MIQRVYPAAGTPKRKQLENSNSSCQTLGDILNSTADYFDNEADSALQRLIAMMEPVMLIVLGIIIGFIVISIIQPIFTMYESIGA